MYKSARSATGHLHPVNIHVFKFLFQDVVVRQGGQNLITCVISINTIYVNFSASVSQLYIQKTKQVNSEQMYALINYTRNIFPPQLTNIMPGIIYVLRVFVPTITVRLPMCESNFNASSF